MSKKKLDILLIEDNPGDAFLIKFYLEDQYSEEYTFHHVDYLKYGLEALASKPYDIVLIDLDLPDSFGIDTVKRVMEAYPKQLLIVLTGLNDEEVGLSTVNAGAQDFIVKGKFDGKVLHSKIRYAIERFNQQSNDNDSWSKDTESALNTVLSLSNSVYVEMDVALTSFSSPNFYMYYNKPRTADFFEIFSDAAQVKSACEQAIAQQGSFNISSTSTEGKPLQVSGTYCTKRNMICVLVRN